MAKIGIIGLGRVGTALAILLDGAGHKIVSALDVDAKAKKRFGKAVPAKICETMDEALPEAEVILICVPDNAIPGVAQQISQSKALKSSVFVGHTSGVLGSDVLQEVKAKGCQAFSMHPIQTFSDIDSAVESIPGSYFGIEGDKDALEMARKIIASLKGRTILLNPEFKPVYHAALCVASNFMVALLDLAVKLCESADIEKGKIAGILFPLVKTTISNFEKSGIKALSGPIERGDVATVRSQLESIMMTDPELLSTFVSLAMATVGVAEEKGSITAGQAKILLKTLEAAAGRRPQSK